MSTSTVDGGYAIPETRQEKVPVNAASEPKRLSERSIECTGKRNNFSNNSIPEIVDQLARQPAWFGFLAFSQQGRSSKTKSRRRCATKLAAHAVSILIA
jgi:hypothetical protein